MDVAAMPFLPLDITIELTGNQKMRPLHEALTAWSDRGADVNALPTMLDDLFSIPEDRVCIAPGGSVANALRVAQCWGCRTALAGVVGEDTAGERIRDADAAASLDIRLVQRQEQKATPLYLFILRAGKLTRLSLMPETTRVTSLFQSHEWPSCAQQLQAMRPRVLHLNTVNQKIIELMDTLPPATRYSVNLRTLPDRAAAAFAMERLLRRTHLLVFSHEIVDACLAYFAPCHLPSQDELRCVALLETFFRLSPTLECVIVTRAAHGLVAQTRNGAPFTMPSFGPVALRDPLGAGDTFTGVLLAGLLRNAWDTQGLPDDMPELLRHSMVAAALNCGRLGATTQIPTPAEVAPHMAHARRLLTPRTLLPEHPVFARGFESASSPLARLNAGIVAAVQQTLGRNDFRALTKDFERTQTLVCVGSGSSFSVALAMARLVARCLPAPYTATAYRPGEYLSLGRQGETVVCITQSGNPDIVAAITHAERLHLTPFLLTAHRGKWAHAVPASHVFSHTGESVQSFVNTRGPCTAVAVALEWMAHLTQHAMPVLEEFSTRYNAACEQVERIAGEVCSSEMTFIVLASGLMLAPLHEFDLKAAETGIAAETYELKGWTHGRYQRVWHNRRARQHALLTLETPADAPIVEGLVARFVRQMHPQPIPVYRLHASDDSMGLWQHFVHVLLLIERLAPTDPTSLSVPRPWHGINRGIALRSP